MHDFKIKFYLGQESKTATGSRPVHVRIYLDGQRAYLTSTKITISEDMWDARDEQVKEETPAGRLKNHRLSILRKTLTDLYHRQEAENHLSVEYLKQAYQDWAKTCDEGVCSFFRQYIRENGEVIGHDNLIRYNLVISLLEKYITYAYHAADIGFADLCPPMLHDFSSYLREEEGYTHPRTLSNKVYTFKTLLGAAMELGMLAQDPFDGYHFQSTKSIVKTEHLTVSEFHRLQRAVFATERLSKVRDCFLFACYTGLSYQEIKALTITHLISLNGSMWILLHGATEDIPRYIPLLPLPSIILQKYRTDASSTALLPLISQQKTNLYLKEIAKECCIYKPLTFRLAVRSFVKTALTAGVSIDTISHIHGKPLLHTMPFSTPSPEKIKEEMQKFVDLLVNGHSL